MAEGARRAARGQPFGTAAASARHQFAWIVSRESLFRLGLSLVLAVALWTYVTGKENPSAIDLGQPIVLSPADVPPGLTITNSLPAVHIQYEVTDSAAQLVTAASFQATVSLLNLRPGTHLRVPVDVVADPGIKVVKVSPQYVAVVIETLLRKTVSVSPSYVVHTPPSGFSAGSPSFEPNSVTITGPESLVSQVAETVVDINLAGVRSSLLALQHPVPVNSQGTPVSGGGKLTISPNLVRVSLPIHAVASFRSLPLLVPIRGHPSGGFGVAGVNVEPPEITAKGSPRVLSSLATASTAPVNVSGLHAGTFKRRVAVQLPAHVSTGTHYATATILVRPVDASSSTEIGVQPQNVTPGLVAHIRPSDVLITVVGPYSSLGRAAHGLSAIVDLTNYAAGVYQLTPRVVAPRGFIVGNVYPRTVTVVVEASTPSG